MLRTHRVEAESRADVLGDEIDLARVEGLDPCLARADPQLTIDAEAGSFERLAVDLRHELRFVEPIRADAHGGLILCRDDGAPTRRPDDRHRCQDRRPEGESAVVPHGYLPCG